MKNNNRLKSILEAAKRPANITNRSFYTRAANAALKTGLVTVEICEAGRHWTDPVAHNVRIKAAGYVRRPMIKGTIEPGDILRHIGLLLTDENVKAKIKSFVSIRATECQKCGGHGIIPQFSYYCSGICFDCGGSGFNMSNEKTIVEINDNK